MRILLLTRYERLGSSSRVRFYQYIPHLAAHGIKLVTAPFFSNGYVQNLYSGQRIPLKIILQAYLNRLSALIHSRSFDMLWVEKELFPWMPAWFETLLSTLNIPYAVDYDDAVFHRYDLNSSFIVRALLGRKIDHVMRHAGLVIAGNDYIAERAAKAGAHRVECLPSVVDVSQYVVTDPTTGPVFRIGWVGSPVTAPYLDLVRKALNQLSRESNVKLILIGAGKVASFRDIPTEILPWSEEIERRISQLFDVGIMPLVDGPFERGKC